MKAKRNILSKLSVMIIGAVWLVGCTKVIDIELNTEENQRLVVDGWLTTKAKKHQVKLTLTTSYFENQQAPKATGATVYVTDGVNQINFPEISPGIYETAVTEKAKYNTNYTLHIEYNGEIYESFVYVDSVSPLDSLSASPSTDIFGDPDGYDINIWTQELPGYGDHYLWRLYKNGTLLTNNLNDIYFETDEYLPDGVYFANWPIEHIGNAVSGDSVRLEQHRISEDAFDTFYAMMMQTDWRGGIFDSPPANVPNNITNGALGYFIISAETEKSCAIP